ncbi:hypothetical protein KIN20_002805 [Parelaphostrongylus tenuis]|uniref:Uncharacterized protein n=1 Tax=Parelaphostrongylus tenuis TaxID=148309 RepID=A0AAD5LZ43_PARTN|nr:hypothetical protein KIN20_002805 [Parelaphostrongylus tenuis]
MDLSHSDKFHLSEEKSRENVKTAEALLEGEAEPQTVTAKSIDTAQDTLKEQTEPLTTAAGILETTQEVVEDETEPLTAWSEIEETALSEISTCSEFSLLPRKTSVGSEFDAHVEASALSTALPGDVSGHGVTRHETEVERGIRAVDSIECRHRVPSSELRPVENCDNLNAG